MSRTKQPRNRSRYHRPCLATGGCTEQTRHLTRLCVQHRTDVPVYWTAAGIRVGSYSLSPADAYRLADRIVDTADGTGRRPHYPPTTPHTPEPAPTPKGGQRH